MRSRVYTDRPKERHKPLSGIARVFPCLESFELVNVWKALKADYAWSRSNPSARAKIWVLLQATSNSSQSSIIARLEAKLQHKWHEKILDQNLLINYNFQNFELSSYFFCNIKLFFLVEKVRIVSYFPHT